MDKQIDLKAKFEASQKIVDGCAALYKEAISFLEIKDLGDTWAKVVGSDLTLCDYIAEVVGVNINMVSHSATTVKIGEVEMDLDVARCAFLYSTVINITTHITDNPTDLSVGGYLSRLIDLIVVAGSEDEALLHRAAKYLRSIPQENIVAYISTLTNDAPVDLVRGVASAYRPTNAAFRTNLLEKALWGYYGATGRIPADLGKEVPDEHNNDSA